MKDQLNKLDDQSRRQFMACAAKTCLGVSLAPLAGFRSAMAEEDREELVEKNCIYLFMPGGMSHIDTFDPKPDSENQGPVESIETSAKGVIISEWLPRLAKQMHKVAVVRSISSTQGDHLRGQYFMRTSYPMVGTIRHPAMGAWLVRLHGRANSKLPGNVRIGGQSRHPGAGFLPSKYGPLPIGDAAAGLQNSKLADDTDQREFKRRLWLANTLDEDFRAEFDYKKVRSYADAYRDAVSLLSSKDLEAFNIYGDPEKKKKSYGDNAFGDGCLLARRLIEKRVRFVEVTLGGWDNHANNFVAGRVQSAMLDQALSALLTDLSNRGLLESTVVVLATEMGRTPTINQNSGRDHWPQTFSGLLAGGGIQGGQVYGKTNADAAEIVDDYVEVPNFNATIAQALELPLEEVVRSPSNRPFTIANKAEPITVLF